MIGWSEELVELQQTPNRLVCTPEAQLSPLSAFLEAAIPKLHDAVAGNTVSKFLNDITTVVPRT